MYLKNSIPVETSDWAYLSAEEVDKERLKPLLTLTSTSKKDRFTVRAYCERDKLFGVPRALTAYVPIKMEWEHMDIPFIGNLRPAQKMLYQQTIDQLANSHGGIIKATTGVGKTVLALALASHYKMPTLVIVPTETIMKQWIDAIKKFTGLDAGIIRQNICEVKAITVGMIHSLAFRSSYGIEDMFGLVIFDECHTVGAELFSRVAPMFKCMYRIGLSATPRRKDGMDNIFLWHIGKVVATHEAFDISPKIVIVNYYSQATSQAGCVWNGDLQLGRYTNKIASDTKRSEVLSYFIWEAYKKGRHILLLSDRLKQLDNIYKLLSPKTGEGVLGYMTGKLKQKDRQILLATYSCAGIGFDKPILDTLILATPRTDIEQAVGRLLRKAVKEHRPTVIDFVDTASPIMVRWGVAREKFYKKCKGEVSRIYV